tara:strand:- start:203 stop:493 length:291 start_codon:yes stop_codon:yes gene_type:complete
MDRFESLPEEIMILITTYLDFKNDELFNCRLINKDYKRVIDNPISLDSYPDLYKCSFFAFTKDYHEHMEHMRQQRLEAERNFQMFYQAMLLDFGWI